MSFSTVSFEGLLEQITCSIRSSNYDATSPLRMELHWPKILQISDLLRLGHARPKIALLSINKRLSDFNPGVAMLGLLVLESCMKNCGFLMHEKIASRKYMEQLFNVINTTIHGDIKNKTLELIQAWAYACRNNPKFKAIQEAVNIMKAKKYMFPALKERHAMFSATPVPKWVEEDWCHQCGIVNVRQHHCHGCGKLFCPQCASKISMVPRFSILKEVRACDSCYNSINKPVAVGSKELEELLLALALSQSPVPRPVALRNEGEELELAMALSQSHFEGEYTRMSRRMFENYADVYHKPSAPVLNEVLNRTHSNTRTSAQFGGGIADALKKQLECPVCLNLATKPIYMCPNGHNVCSACQPQLFECPICRHGGRPSNRNRLAEDLAESALASGSN